MEAVSSSLEMGRGSQWCHRVAVFLLLLLPLGLMLGKATTDIPIVGIGVSFVYFSFLEKDFTWLKTAWFRWALMFWIWVMFISVFSVNSVGAFKAGLVLIRFPLFAAALAHWLLCDRKVRQIFLWSLSISVVFAALDLWLQYLSGYDILGKPAQMVFPLSDASGYVHHASRLTGMTRHPNPGSKVMMLVFPFMAFVFNKIQQQKTQFALKVFLFVLLLVTLLAVPITGERTPSLLLLLGLGLAFILIKQQRVLTAMTTAAVLLVGAALIQYNPFLNDRYVRLEAALQDITAPVVNYLKPKALTAKTQAIAIEPKVHHYGASAYRRLFTTSWRIFKSQPITGIGVRQFFSVCMASPKFSGFCSTSPQNMYLELLTCTGIVGFLLFMAMACSWLKAIVSRRGTNNISCRIFKNNPVTMAVAIALLIRFWPLIGASSLFFSWNAMSYWLMAGWLLGCVVDLEKNTNKTL